MAKAKARGKGQAVRVSAVPLRALPTAASFFLKGECKNGDNCLFPHLNQEAADEINRAKGLAKAKAKAAAKPKAKAAVAVPRVATLWPALVMPAPPISEAGGCRTVRRRSRTSL